MDGKLDERKPQNRMVLDAEREKEYAGSLSGIFDELMEFSMETGRCRGVFYTEGGCRLSVNQSFEDFRTFAWENIHPEECRDFLGIFNREHMRKIMEEGKPLRHEFRCRDIGRNYIWLRILLIPESGRGDTVLCYVSDLGDKDGENYLLRQIVERYVYRNCDYLICLDADKDSYTMFKRNEGSDLLPQESSGSYSQMVQTCIKGYVVPEDREMVDREMEIRHVLSVLDAEGEHIITYGVKDPEKGYLRKRFQYVYYDRPGRIVFLMRSDITEEYQEQLRQKERLKDALKNARVDSLTGLYNRQAICREISRFLESPACSRAVLLFMDLDDFKNINDTMGHRSGDYALRCVADLFRHTLRATDMVGRVGGDEFVALLTGISAEKGGVECAKRLCEAVSSMEDPNMGGLKLSCSIGGAVCPKDGNDYDTLFVKADTAAYEAKRQGKNRYVFYTPGLELKNGYCSSSMS